MFQKINRFPREKKNYQIQAVKLKYINYRILEVS